MLDVLPLVGSVPVNGTAWFNTKDYTILELILFGGGCYLWVPVYMIYMRQIRKIHFVEMPLFVACANIAWEFVWGFVHAPDVGIVVWRCYQIWFLLDIYIFWAVLKYGFDQFPAALRRWFVPTCIATAILWALGIHFMIISGIDTPIGAVSAYLDNLCIAALYIILILRLPSGVGNFSWAVAWMKMLGTGLNTIFMNMHYPDNYFLRFIAITTTCIDCFYIWIYWQRRRAAARMA